MKDAYYFSHDSNAKSDPKISAMINQYGIEGYGRFWIVVEILREQQQYRLPLKKYIFDALAMQMQCAAEAAENYIKDCIETFELFASDGEYFWSNSLIRRMKQKEDRSRQASEAAKKRWEQSGSNANAMQTQCGSNASKGKESKRKIKDHNNNDNARAREVKISAVPVNEDGHVGDVFVNKPGENAFEQYRKSISHLIKPPSPAILDEDETCTNRREGRTARGP